MYSTRYSLATSHFFLTLLLASTLFLPVDALFKLLDENAELVHNPLDEVVYLFQFPRTSTTPSQAAYNLMVETWLHWKQIPFHRISNQLFLGSHSLGTAPFAYFNGEYIDGSVEIIKTVGQHFNKYQKAEGEDELMQKILEMFNILMVDRVASLEWMVKDEALVEIIVPQLINGQQINVQLEDGNYSIDVNAEFWKQYFDAFNAMAKSAKVEFVKNFLKKTNETNQKNGTDEQRWDDFNTWLRSKVITRTMETVLTEEVDGKQNSVNPANSQAKLKKFLEKNSLTDLDGKTKPYSEYSEAKIIKELKDRWNFMTELVEKNQNASLHQEAQTMPDAALFGVLIQYFETPLNRRQFRAISAKSGALFEFTQNVKRSLGLLDDQKWEELTKRPWLLNYDKAFYSKDLTYYGPYKLKAVDLDQITLSSCLSYENQIVSFSDNCTGVPNEIVMAAKALMRIANAAKKLDHRKLAEALLAVMASYVCQVGKKCTDKHMKYAMKMYKEELKVKKVSEINQGIAEARKTVFEAINAYNDAKTGEAVRAAVLEVRAVVNNGGEAAIAAVSSTDLTNEY